MWKGWWLRLGWRPRDAGAALAASPTSPRLLETSILCVVPGALSLKSHLLLLSSFGSAGPVQDAKALWGQPSQLDNNGSTQAERQVTCAKILLQFGTPFLEA